jgi:hypothetical protein
VRYTVAAIVAKESALNAREKRTFEAHCRNRRWFAHPRISPLPPFTGEWRRFLCSVPAAGRSDFRRYCHRGGHRQSPKAGPPAAARITTTTVVCRRDWHGERAGSPSPHQQLFPCGHNRTDGTSTNTDNQSMPDTGERREIASRTNANEAETVQRSKKLLSKTKQLFATADAKNLARKAHRGGPARWCPPS